MYSILLEKLSLGRASMPVILLLGLLAGCATTTEIEKAPVVTDDNWLNAVLDLRAERKIDPDNVELKSRLMRLELQAANFYDQQGQNAMDQDEYERAVLMFQQGLVAMPEQEKLLHNIEIALSKREARLLYQEGLRYEAIGKLPDAQQAYQQSSLLDAEYDDPEFRLLALQEKQDALTRGRLVLSSKEPVTLNFNNAEFKNAFEFIAKAFNINIIFDNTVKNLPITLFAENVTFEQALNLMLTTTDTFYKTIGPNTILVSPDTTVKRGQYDDYSVRVFQLNTISAKQMADILKGVLSINKVVVNEQSNSIIIRETNDLIEMASQLIEVNDIKSAEIILDVELLEVSRNRAELLGFDYGSKTTLSFPDYPVSESFESVLRQGVLTVPAITFNYFKQDADSKILANPKIRVLNKQDAKVHIGDRVPLRSSTILDTSGQTRTTFEYRDIGIRLNVNPTIHLDNSATVKMTLDVSTLGQNLGTADEPAFSIGTRNTETIMLLKDGETAVLAGLIQDSERNSVTKVPGLGDIPVLGGLFSTNDDNVGRTDILLTITPHVIRPWKVASTEQQAFYSGSKDSYSQEPKLAYLNEYAAGGVTPILKIGTPGASSTQEPPIADVTETRVISAAPASPTTTANAVVPTLSFEKSVYQASRDEEFEVVLVGENLQGVGNLPLEILFNAQLIQFIDASSAIASDFSASVGEGNGSVVINLDFDAQGLPTGRVELARLLMRGIDPGVSFMVYRNAMVTTAQGSVVRAQVEASRSVIQ